MGGRGGLQACGRVGVRVAAGACVCVHVCIVVIVVAIVIVVVVIVMDTSKKNPCRITAGV